MLVCAVLCSVKKQDHGRLRVRIVHSHVVGTGSAATAASTLVPTESKRSLKSASTCHKHNSKQLAYLALHLRNTREKSDMLAPLGCEVEGAFGWQLQARPQLTAEIETCNDTLLLHGILQSQANQKVAGSHASLFSCYPLPHDLVSVRLQCVAVFPSSGLSAAPWCVCREVRPFKLVCSNVPLLTPPNSIAGSVGGPTGGDGGKPRHQFYRMCRPDESGKQPTAQSQLRTMPPEPSLPFQFPCALTLNPKP